MASDHSSIKSDTTRSLHRSHGSFELAFAPLILALGGLWLDKTLGTVPIFTVVLAVFGICGAAVKVYYSYRNSMAELDAASPWARTEAEAS